MDTRYGGRRMLLIDLEMPDRCETCPCVHLFDGEGNGDYCQINFNDLTLEQIERKRPEWCPLKEVKDGN